MMEDDRAVLRQLEISIDLSSPHCTPETLTTAHQALWDARATRLGTSHAVHPCPYDRSQLLRVHEAGCRLGYLPDTMCTQQDRHKLAELFPSMSSYALHADNVVTNDEDACGWFEYEVAIGCPYGATNEHELLQQIEGQGRVLLTLNQYIVASQDNHLLTGHHLDEGGSWSRIGSRVDGRLVDARFDGNVEASAAPAYVDPVAGSLLVGYDLGPEDHGPTHGARTTSTRHRRVVPPLHTGRVTLGILRSQSERLEALDIDAEFSRQVSLYVQLGFHAEIGMNPDDYRSSFPRFGTRGLERGDRFDMPVLVETRISWRRQARLAKIRFVEREKDYAPVDDRSRMPNGPYAAWFASWGRRFEDGISPASARAQLAGDEVGANLCDLLAVTIVDPNVSASGRFFDAIGYHLPYIEYKDDLTLEGTEFRTPGMYHWRGAPEIGANLHPRAFSHFRPLVRWAEVRRADEGERKEFRYVRSQLSEADQPRQER